VSEFPAVSAGQSPVTFQLLDSASAKSDSLNSGLSRLLQKFGGRSADIHRGLTATNGAWPTKWWKRLLLREAFKLPQQVSSRYGF